MSIHMKIIHTVQKMLGEVRLFSIVNLSHLPVVACYKMNYELSGAGTVFHFESL